MERMDEAAPPKHWDSYLANHRQIRQPICWPERRAIVFLQLG